MITIMVYIAILLLCGLLALVSYIEQLYTESGKFLTREFQENLEAFEKLVEPRLVSTSGRAFLAMAVLAHLCTAAIALLIAYLVFLDLKWTVPEIAQAAVGIILVVIVCNRLAPYVMFTRTRGEWLARFVPLLKLLIYMMLPVTVALSFGLSVAALAKPHEPEEPEHPSEAVDALIEAGREEGILEESDRQLIQSVVEFGDKTVRGQAVFARANLCFQHRQHPGHGAVPRPHPDCRRPGQDHHAGQAGAPGHLRSRDQEDISAFAGDAERQHPPGHCD